MRHKASLPAQSRMATRVAMLHQGQVSMARVVVAQVPRDSRAASVTLLQLAASVVNPTSPEQTPITQLVAVDRPVIVAPEQPGVLAAAEPEAVPTTFLLRRQDKPTPEVVAAADRTDREQLVARALSSSVLRQSRSTRWRPPSRDPFKPVTSCLHPREPGPVHRTASPING